MSAPDLNAAIDRLLGPLSGAPPIAAQDHLTAETAQGTHP
jgi:hypothetical protein